MDPLVAATNTAANRTRIALLLAHANDEAVRRQWRAGRGVDEQQHELSVEITEPEDQQLLALDAYTVQSQLPASPDAFPLHNLLAPHNSKPNSGTLRKQPARAECHSNSQAALVYDFSGISCRYEPQPVGEEGGGDAAAAEHLMGLATVRIQGTCKVTLPSADNQQAAAAGGTSEHKLKAVRWLVVRQSLPDAIEELLQPQLQELQRFKAHEQQQKQAQEQAAAAGRRKPTKKAYRWSGTPLWWVPYDLFVEGGAGWVGGIASYEFPEGLQLGGGGGGVGEQQSVLPMQQQQEWMLLQQQQQQQLAAWQFQQQQQHVAGAVPPLPIPPLHSMMLPQELLPLQPSVTLPQQPFSAPIQPGGLDAAAMAAAAAATQEAMDAAAAAAAAVNAAGGISPLMPSDTAAAATAAGAGGGDIAAGGGGYDAEMHDIFSTLQAADSPPAPLLPPPMHLSPAAEDAGCGGGFSAGLAALQHMLPAGGDPVMLLLEQQHQQQHQQPQHVMLPPPSTAISAELLLPPQQAHDNTPLLLGLPQLQRHQPPQFDSRQHKQQQLDGLQQQLDTLTLQEQQTRAEIQLTRLQPPCVSLQQQAQLSKQLNSSCQLLKTLLLAVCAGYCSDSSADLFPQLLLHVEQHNRRVADAAVQGLVGVDRHSIDVLSLCEKKHGRSLLHLLVSGFPEPVLVPEGSLKLEGPQELVQHVVQTSAELSAHAAVILPPASSLSYLTHAAATAARSTASKAADSGGSSGGGGGAGVSVSGLAPAQRLQLLSQLRAHAVQHHRWPELLRCCNSNGATPWLTACHWCLPEVLQGLVDDTQLDLQQDMLCPTKNGRLFYHVICREACNWQQPVDKARFRQALTITLTALADKVAESAPSGAPAQKQQHSCQDHQQQQQDDIHAQSESVNKRPRLTTSGDVAAAGRESTTLLDNERQQGDVAVGGSSSGSVEQQQHPTRKWPAHVLAVLQQQYIFHTDRPRYDVDLLHDVVKSLFGFDMQPPHGGSAC